MKLIAFVLLVLFLFAVKLPVGEALESARTPASVVYQGNQASNR